jgi:hypothetical protein
VRYFAKERWRICRIELEERMVEEERTWEAVVSAVELCALTLAKLPPILSLLKTP